MNLPYPYSASAILDRQKNLCAAGFDEGMLPTRIGNLSLKDRFPPLMPNGINVDTGSGITHIETHGAIPLGKDTFLGIGADWTLTKTVSSDGLAIFRVNRNTSDDTVLSVDLVELIQDPNNARIPESDEKPFRHNAFFSFTSSGRFWFVDAWVSYPIGTRRHLGFFNVETYDYLDLKDRTDIIDKINAGRDVIDAAAGRAEYPLKTNFGLFRF
jgi:hypothetical protein